MLALLVWLPFEDTQMWTALALAAGGCLWLALRWQFAKSHPTNWLHHLAAGALLGAAAPLLAVALMALKSGLHAHGFADFTARQLWEVMNLIPLASILGALAGLAISMSVIRNL